MSACKIMDIFTLGIAAVLGILLITTLPLYFAVRFLGGEASILRLLPQILLSGLSIFLCLPSLHLFCFYLSTR